MPATEQGTPGIETRLAARLSNPADEPATDLQITLTTSSEHLNLPVPEFVAPDVPPHGKVIVDFPVLLEGAAPFGNSLNLRLHTAYKSVGVNRGVHARGDISIGVPPLPIPVTMRFVTDAPVAPDRTDLFHGRDRELSELKDAFAGGSLRRLYFVNGIRRVGKSSLMTHLGRVLTPNVLALVLDFEVDRGLNDAGLVRQLLRKAGERLRSMPGCADVRITLPGPDEFQLDPPWVVFEETLRDLQRQTDRQILVCFDELQVLVERITDPSEPVTDSLLSWMRDKVQTGSDILLVCTGSEKYDRIRARYEDTRLWGNMQPFDISFVGRRAMEDIVTTPLQGDGVTKEKLGYWTLDNSVDLHRRCSSTRWLPECRSSSLLSH